MNRSIAQVTLVVSDYDEAIAFYTQKLDFELIDDTLLDRNKRWVTIAPKGTKTFLLLLAKASDEKQRKAIGNQTGGRVFLFLRTDDFWRDYSLILERGVHFVRGPKKEPYGTVGVFQDLYGNLWDLIQYT